MKSPGVDDRTGEPILLDIRTAPGAYWAFLDPGPWTSLLGLSYWAPWRALVLGALMLAAAAATRSDLLMGLAVLVMVLVGTSECAHRRDFMTSKRLVRQSGFFGRRRRELPLADIDHVYVTYPKSGERFSAANVEVNGARGGFTFVGVADAEGVANAIIRTRDA